tara:strand:+ start:574 stop:1062 length:489 start_codon:yes stop_codon:yes gene_type:complete
MSKKSRRRNKVLAAMVGLAGASKLGLIGKMKSGVVGDKFASAKKAMTSNAAMRGGTGVKGKGPLLGVADGITKLKRSDLPSPRNMKSIFAQDDGSIIKGLEKFKNKDVYSKTMKERRGESTGFKQFLNKAILGRKTQLNKGKMVKARGGGMAMGGMKPTKLY